VSSIGPILPNMNRTCT